MIYLPKNGDFSPIFSLISNFQNLAGLAQGITGDEPPIAVGAHPRDPGCHPEVEENDPARNRGI